MFSRTAAQSSRKPGLFDADLDETRSMRSKEVANDYRYFPDPDLLPVELEDRLHRGDCKASLPELPDERTRTLYSNVLGLSAYDAGGAGGRAAKPRDCV